MAALMLFASWPIRQRGEVAVDVDLDAVGAFVAVAQAADGGGFAEAFDAVGATQADDHQGLVLHRVHRQLGAGG